MTRLAPAAPSCSSALFALALTSCALEPFEPVVGSPDAAADGQRDACRAAAEACNGVDDDCDGTIDEDLSRACFSACRAGTETCAGGAWTDCTAPPVATESCDGTDEDCDGAIDEGVTRTCANACGAAGTEICDDGVFGGCDAPPVPVETCNAVDDDCDGAIDEAPADCGCGVEPYEERSYLFCERTSTWLEARTFCQARGYDLVVVDDAAEDAWVMTTALARQETDRWLGLRYARDTGWEWIDGTTPAYTNWKLQEPNVRRGLCVVFEDGGQNGEERMRWAANECDLDQSFVCESP